MNTGIDWQKYNDALTELKYNTLMWGEEKTLTVSEISEINQELTKILQLSKHLSQKMQTARSRFYIQRYGSKNT